MTRFRRLVDDTDGEPIVPIFGSFGSNVSRYDLERGMLRMQSADPASLHRATASDSIQAAFGTAGFSDPVSGLAPGGVGLTAQATAGLLQLQAKTNHPASPQKAAGELARLYDLFAHSAKPSALLTGRKQIMEAALLPAFMGSGPQNRTISTIVQAFTVYWLGAPVTGGGVVTAFLGAPELAAELTSIFASRSNSSQQIARRLTRCFNVATTRVQYTIPPAVIGFMVIAPPLSI